MVLELAPLVAGLASFVPGLAALFILYGPFDGYFRDNVVFLWFVGGLLAGLPVALLDAWVQVLALPLFYVLGAPLVEQGAKLVFLNRKKWQGERHSVWNGGAMGAGLGTMVALVFAYQTFAGGFSVPTGAAVVLTGIGVCFVHVATGLALGVSVLKQTPFGGYAKAAALTVPLTVLLFADRLFLGTDVPLFLLPAFIAAYGIGLLALAKARWIPEGVGADELRRLRRAARAKKRDAPGPP